MFLNAKSRCSFAVSSKSSKRLRRDMVCFGGIAELVAAISDGKSLGGFKSSFSCRFKSTDGSRARSMESIRPLIVFGNACWIGRTSLERS